MKTFLKKILGINSQKPIVYICMHKGVTGIVCASDFRSEVARMRKVIKEKGGWVKNKWPVRPNVYPVFLFSNNKISKWDLIIGTVDELHEILKNYAGGVEFRDFCLPDLNTHGTKPSGYYNLLDKVIREENPERINWSLDQVKDYLSSKKA